MASVPDHIQHARREKRDFIEAAKNPEMSDNSMAQHLHLSVEHALKALLSYESGGRLNSDDEIHRLGQLHAQVDGDISEFEEFIYKIDGNYTYARYDARFSAGFLKGWGQVAEQLSRLISTIENYVESQIPTSSSGS